MKKSIFTLILAAALSNAMAQTEPATVLSAPMSKAEVEKMEAYEKYATPGEEHANIAKDDGKWSEEITMWMAPGAPPIKNKSSVINSMILGGRYQRSIHKGDFNGTPFEGVSTLAYDNAKKSYISTWIDNMGTGIMVMEGKPSTKGKTLHMQGKMVDALTGKDMDVREEITFVDANTQIMKMFLTPIDGKEFQTMEIVMKRAKVD